MFLIQGPAGSGKSTLMVALEKAGAQVVDLDLLGVHTHDQWEINLTLLAAAYAQGVRIFGGTGGNIREVEAFLRGKGELDIMVIDNDQRSRSLQARNVQKGIARWTYNRSEDERDINLACAAASGLAYVVQPRVTNLAHPGGTCRTELTTQLAFPFPAGLRLGWRSEGTRDSDDVIDRVRAFIHDNRGRIIREASRVSIPLKRDLWERIPGFGRLCDELQPLVDQIVKNRHQERLDAKPDVNSKQQRL